MKKTKIFLELNTCQECPFFEKIECYSADDSDEWKFNWFCGKTKATNIVGKKIAECVNWNEEATVAVPTWCPIKLNDEVNLFDLIGQ